MKRYDYKPAAFENLSDDLVAAYDYWKALTGTRLGPTWREFDLLALAPQVIPFTNVVDVVDGGGDFYVRFYGTSLSEIFGAENSRRLVSEVHPAEMGAAALKSFQEVVAARAPVFCSAVINPRHMSTLQTLVRLPLSDDGETVSHIVSVSHYEHGLYDSRVMVEEAFAEDDAD